MSDAKIESPAARVPGEAGIWVIIFGDLMVFGLFFVTYLFYRGENLELFSKSQQSLNGTIGIINTLLLLTSSWFVASACQSLRTPRADRAWLLFVGALMCGLGFVFMKIIEYSEKINQGYTPATNDFYIYYFMYTGIHLVHVLIGSGVLVYMILASRRSSISPGNLMAIESGGIFWHMVDLLWIVLFALFYLVH